MKDIFFFANTLWFLVNFKNSFILSFARQPNVNVYLVYFTFGPPISKSYFDEYRVSNVKCINFLEYVLRYSYNLNPFKRTYLFYTIIPLALNSFPFLFPFGFKVFTVEGLGRLFSSRRSIHRSLRRVIIHIYSYVFSFYADAVCVLNYEDYSYLLKRSICSIAKLHVVPGTGVPLSTFTPLSCQPSKNLVSHAPFVFTYIGRVNEDKGFWVFISAAICAASRASYTFRFVAVIPEKDISCFTSSELDIFHQHNITLSPYSSSVIEYYRSTHVLVIPTVYAEGLSRVALEASILGVPIIAFHNQGLSRLFGDKDSVLLLSNKTVASLSSAMIAMYHDWTEYIQRTPYTSKSISLLYSDTQSVSAMNSILSSLV